jgi:hypothetical protein
MSFLSEESRLMRSSCCLCVPHFNLWASSLIFKKFGMNFMALEVIKFSCFSASYLWLYSPFVGPWSLFSFLILCTVGKTPWTEDQSVARPLPIRRTTRTQNKHTQTSMPRVGFEAWMSVCVWVGEDCSCLRLRPCGHCDWLFSFLHTVKIIWTRTGDMRATLLPLTVRSWNVAW